MLLISNLVVIATDRAGVKIGAKTGLTARFKEEWPWLLANHCMAHRLLLSAEKATNAVSYITKHIGILNQFAKFLKFSTKLCRILSNCKDMLECQLLSRKSTN